ncbi:MAG: hypothetical protein EOP60_08070 [Sphingomonadales bacterium]|nr:MAG: hypothetical protein EOP60_08070 [Sphingomonadales bacterium]
MTVAEGNRGAPRDPRAVVRYAALSCKSDLLDGCIKLGNLAANAKLYGEAVHWYGRACTLRNQQSCIAQQDMQRNLPNTAATAVSPERARWDAAQAAGAAEIDKFLRVGNYGAAMNKAAHGMGSVDQVSRVLVAAQGAGRIGDIEDTYFWAFGTWQLNTQARSIVEAEWRGRRLGKPTWTAASGPATGARASSGGTNGPSLADQVLETHRRQNRENCAAAAKGANRACNPSR